MPELSAGVVIAWQIAAGEARRAEHQFIEKEHLLIGICSLEEVLALDALEEKLEPDVEGALQWEADAVEKMLEEFELSSIQLRRAVRRALGKGDYTDTPKRSSTVARIVRAVSARRRKDI